MWGLEALEGRVWTPLEGLLGYTRVDEPVERMVGQEETLVQPVVEDTIATAATTTTTATAAAGAWVLQGLGHLCLCWVFWK